eukprot:2089701-Rhodomonas_salina.1
MNSSGLSSSCPPHPLTSALRVAVWGESGHDRARETETESRRERERGAPRRTFWRAPCTSPAPPAITPPRQPQTHHTHTTHTARVSTVHLFTALPTDHTRELRKQGGGERGTGWCLLVVLEDVHVVVGGVVELLQHRPARIRLQPRPSPSQRRTPARQHASAVTQHNGRPRIA